MFCFTTTRFLERTVYLSPTNLHHGRFIFRHKGKKRKGKPNYPPFKPIVKSARRWRKPIPKELRP